MKVRIGICALTIVAMLGVARAVAPEKSANTAKQTSANVAASSAGKQSISVSGAAKPSGGTQLQTSEAKKNKPAARPKRATVQKAASKEEVSESTGAGESAAAKPRKMLRSTGQRDPFETVIRSQPEGPGCASGKKCLVVDKMDLKGVVRSQNGMIAIVSTDQRKTYFLHENDPIYNGHVVKISPDSIVFRETVTDRVGRQSTRDVVKRITRPAA